MLKLRTKTEFTAPGDRVNVTTTIRLIVDGIFFDANNADPKGYYYYNDENGKLVQKKINALKQWTDIESAEVSLPTLESSVNIKANILQRLKEFVLLQIMMEAGQNFGTTDTDWEEDIEEPIAPEE